GDPSWCRSFYSSIVRPPPCSPPFPYTTLFRSVLVAGGGSQGENVPATQAKLIQPFGIDFDRAGNFYLVELKGERVLKVDPKGTLDRKSTRLNSSHVSISYAVFCLKKKINHTID